MKFIHTGDLHLGYKFSSSYREETLKILKENQKKALKDIINLANDKKADYIFIAGDLFDLKNPDEELYLFVCEEFKRTDAKIFISAGNHDPFTSDSVYNKPFPENTVIFPGEITSYSFDDCDIYGYSFINSHKTDNSFSGFKVKDENKINIMVAHGDLVADSFYNPILPSDIEKSGLSYMALGHIHISDGLKSAGRTLYGYSGTPLSMTFKETAENFVIFGEINDGSIRTEKINLASHFFKELSVDISDSSSDEDTLKILKSHLSGYEISKTLFSVTLTGSRPESYIPDLLVLTDRLDSHLYLRLNSDLRISYNIDLIKEEKTVRGEFVRNALKMLGDKDTEYVKKVIEYGVKRL